jgi:hypothetical protein
MDHEAFKALLNTSHPSGKLAWWGMVLQLDLQIAYQPGKANARAEELFCYPVLLLPDDLSVTQAYPVVVAVETLALSAEHVEECAEESLSQ